MWRRLAIPVVLAALLAATPAHAHGPGETFLLSAPSELETALPKPLNSS